MDSVTLLLVLMLAGLVVLGVIGVLDNHRRDRERRDHP